MFKPEVFVALSTWEVAKSWHGKLVAICDYEASYTAPNPSVWTEGYSVLWHLTNARLMGKPIPYCGNVGMWRLPEDVKNILEGRDETH